eukprot:TRINITY_DN2315_c0_g2_i11.p1 TRINITY_DN2315_c0_g2~~TRINITY_DN2315_c0_g2_i11.p1  ORF type:complete len:335 (-),score=80.15 TRINITY_DN2315_c0_g2_i11:10-1014(-)
MKKTDGDITNQIWQYDSNTGIIRSKAEHKCVLDAFGGVAKPTTPIIIWHAKGILDNSNQRWEIVTFTGEVPAKSASEVHRETITYPPSILKHVPKLVHYVWVNPKPSPIPLFTAVSIEACAHVMKPEAIYIHCYHEPIGDFWNVVKHLVTVVKINNVDNIFDRPVNVIQHVADVVRLNVLRKYGGIYMDTDIIPIRSFDEFLEKDMVMGQENPGALCNAFIMSKCDSPFLERWYQEYRTFNDSEWNNHSVIKPAQLSSIFPHEITIIPKEQIYSPDYGQRNQIFESCFDVTNNYAIHLWASGSTQWTSVLSVKDIMEKDTTFNKLARPYVSKWI